MYFKIFRYSKAYFTYLLFLFEPPFQKIAVVNSNVSNYQQEDQLSSPHNSVIYQRLIFSETLIVTGTVSLPFQLSVIFKQFKYTLKPRSSAWCVRVSSFTAQSLHTFQSALRSRLYLHKLCGRVSRIKQGSAWFNLNIKKKKKVPLCVLFWKNSKQQGLYIHGKGAFVQLYQWRGERIEENYMSRWDTVIGWCLRLIQPGIMD